MENGDSGIISSEPAERCEGSLILIELELLKVEKYTDRRRPHKGPVINVLQPQLVETATVMAYCSRTKKGVIQ